MVTQLSPQGAAAELVGAGVGFGCIRRVRRHHRKTAMQRAVAAPQFPAENCIAVFGLLQCSARSLHRSFRQKTAMQFSAFAIYWCKMLKTAMQLFARLHFFQKNCNAVFVRCTAFPSRVCQRLHQPPLRSRVCPHTPRQVTTDPQCANHTNRLWLCT